MVVLHQEHNQGKLVEENLNSLRDLVVPIKIIKPLLYLQTNPLHLEQLKNQHKLKYLDLLELQDQQFIKERDPYLDLEELLNLQHLVQMIQKNYLRSLEVQQKRIQNLTLEKVPFSPLLDLHIQQLQDQKKPQHSSILMDLPVNHLQKQIIMDLVPLLLIYNPNQQYHLDQNQLQFYLSLLGQVKKEIQSHIMVLDLLESLSVLLSRYFMITQYHKEHLGFLEIPSSLLQNQITMVYHIQLLLDCQKIKRKITLLLREPEYSSYNIPI